MAIAPPLPDAGPNQTEEQRRAISERFIIHAREELAEGNRLQAGEKTWGAVSQYLKVIGQNRGWSHDGHGHMVAIAHQMLLEYPEHASPELYLALTDADHKGHRNFYKNNIEEDDLLDVIDDTENVALPKLRILAELPPRRFEIGSESQRKRLVKLTGDKTLKMHQVSDVGFSPNYERRNGNGHSDPDDGTPVKRPPPGNPGNRPQGESSQINLTGSLEDAVADYKEAQAAKKESAKGRRSRSKNVDYVSQQRREPTHSRGGGRGGQDMRRR